MQGQGPSLGFPPTTKTHFNLNGTDLSTAFFRAPNFSAGMSLSPTPGRFYYTAFPVTCQHFFKRNGEILFAIVATGFPGLSLAEAPPTHKGSFIPGSEGHIGNKTAGHGHHMLDRIGRQ